jgi:hypothetical protein
MGNPVLAVSNDDYVAEKTISYTSWPSPNQILPSL